MSALVINLFPGQRMDITVLMKDADTVVEIFRKNHVHFYKKYTSIPDNSASTITFKGIKSDDPEFLYDSLLTDLHNASDKDEIGEVHVRFTSFTNNRPKKKPIVVNTVLPEVTAPVTDDDTL